MAAHPAAQHVAEVPNPDCLTCGATASRREIGPASGAMPGQAQQQQKAIASARPDPARTGIGGSQPPINA